MIPIVLDPARLAIGLVGRAEPAVRRLVWLREGGARPALFTDDPASALAGLGASRRLPGESDLAALDLLWIADLEPEIAAPLARVARGVGLLVNVEDQRALCDFHNPALVRRGELLLTVSTGGASPGLAARIRRDLAERYDAAWAERLALLATRRRAWRRRGRPLAELARLTDAAIDARGWLPMRDRAA